MVQRCIDVLAGSDATVAILPAGTANSSRRISASRRISTTAVESACTGAGTQFDVGRHQRRAFRGDGRRRASTQLMIRDADGALKNRFGRAAYIWTGAKNFARAARSARAFASTGRSGSTGRRAACLIGNVGKIMGDIAAFPDARPDDGLLEIGVVTAKGAWQWSRTLARTVAGKAEKSPFVQVVERKGVRHPVRRRRSPTSSTVVTGSRRRVCASRCGPAAVTVCVPESVAHEYRDPGPGNLGAHRRRRPTTSRVVGAAADCCATRSFAYVSPTDSATPVRSRTQRLSCSSRRRSPSSVSPAHGVRARTT